jgi:S-formylglutathione hydrolase FrmB
MTKFRVLVIIILLHPAILLRAQTRHILQSGHLPKADTVWVFTPATYTSKPAAKFPVVYLLHGWNGSYHQWNDITGCQQLADRYGFIIVCPDALTDSWYINSPAIKKSRYTDFFFLDLMPYIAGHYRTDTANRFITGLSMGGHGALYLFCLKPGLFRSAGSLSGVMELGPCRNDYRISDYLGLTGGKTDSVLLQTYSVSGNIRNAAGTGKAIIFSCGTSDRFYPMNNRLKQLCDKYGITATYLTGPGGHTYAYWKSAIGAHLDFFVKQLRK